MLFNFVLLNNFCIFVVENKDNIELKLERITYSINTMRTISKSEFRELVNENNNRTGKEIRISDVIMNQGVIYNPRVNGGNGYSFTGPEAREKTVESLWRIARKNGSIEFNGESIEII